MTRDVTLEIRGKTMPLCLARHQSRARHSYQLQDGFSIESITEQMFLEKLRWKIKVSCSQVIFILIQKQMLHAMDIFLKSQTGIRKYVSRESHSRSCICEMWYGTSIEYTKKCIHWFFSIHMDFDFCHKDHQLERQERHYRKCSRSRDLGAFSTQAELEKEDPEDLGRRHKASRCILRCAKVQTISTSLRSDRLLFFVWSWMRRQRERDTTSEQLKETLGQWWQAGKGSTISLSWATAAGERCKIGSCNTGSRNERLRGSWTVRWPTRRARGQTYWVSRLESKDSESGLTKFEIWKSSSCDCRNSCDVVRDRQKLWIIMNPADVPPRPRLL